MRRKKIFLLVSMFLSLLMIGCSKDEPSDPNKPDSVDPSGAVADPVGTVTMRMRNDKETKLGELYMSSDNNFYCSKGMIASLGPVNGLGNVSDIPQSGWSDQMAINLGYGYMYYDDSNYYRIYTTQWMKNSYDEITGIEFKYQSPFKGVDEEIVLENSVISFSGKGGEADVWFTNESIIPFSVSCEEDWCHVSRTVSTDRSEKFLYDGVRVSVDANQTKEESTAKVEIKTLSGKRTILTVVRGSETPELLFPNGTSEYTLGDISANGDSQTISITTNIELADFVVTSSSDWFTAEMKDSNTTRKVARFVEGVDGTPQPITRGPQQRYLSYNIMPNTSGQQREATLTLGAKGNQATATMKVSQLPGTLEIDTEKPEVDAKAQEVMISFTTNISSDFVITSDKAWCKPAMDNITIGKFNGSTVSQSARLVLESNASSSNREAIVTIATKKGTLNAKIQISQKGVSSEDFPTKVYFNKNSQNRTLTLPVENLTVKTDADWCDPSVIGNQLVIRVTKASEDRKAKVTINIPGSPIVITIVQSKYAVGDSYDEKGIKGTVCFMEEDRRYVRSQLLGSAIYSDEEVPIGAIDEDNGQKNMNAVKSIKSWRSHYPAFVLCDDLNVNGISGWYLPAVNETIGISGAWSSTEYSNVNAFILGGGTCKKTLSKDVYAIHAFVD